MLKHITLICDRCKGIIEGTQLVLNGKTIMTGGYYSKSSGLHVFDTDEFIICDDCVIKDERYQKIYNNIQT